jgi:hypothetical protein
VLPDNKGNAPVVQQRSEASGQKEESRFISRMGTASPIALSTRKPVA